MFPDMLIVRLELNRSAIRDKLRLVTSNAQIGELFATDAATA
jgi:hypothetical protein